MKQPIVACVIVLISASLSAMGSEDPLLTIACGVALALTIGLLWRPDEPAILLIPVGTQLIQVVTPLFYANLLGVSVQHASLHIGDVTEATWLGLAAIVSLAVGMWCGQLRARDSAALVPKHEALAWAPPAAFAFCIATIVLAAMFEVLSEYFEGMRQPLLAVGGIQWVGVYVLASICMTRRRGYAYLLIVTCLEVVKGFAGYFADFKLVFFVLVAAAFAGGSRLSSGRIFFAAAAATVLLILSVWWSAIKTEYRDYISEFSNQQVVVVPFEDRMAFLINKLSQVDGQTMKNGLERLVKRIGYIDYLSATMRYVPSHLPFQNGAQIGATILHVLQPRLLFPEKPSLPNDSKVMEKYTGIRFGKSSGSGTSVSLGYVAELYVDFGALGAVVSTFLIGLLVGRTFRFVRSSNSLPAVITDGLAIMLVMTITQFEEALIKIVGSFVTALCAILVLKRFVLPHLLTVFGSLNHWKVLAHSAK